MSLARQHRERTLATQAASAPATGGGLAPATVTQTATPAGRAARQITLRLQHDLRRLKEIKAISLKIAAKREMLPEYRAWCDGELEAGRMTVGDALGTSDAAEVLPTIMVWSIDVGDWQRALELAAHVLRHDVPMPARYERDAATVVLEQIATAALKVQAANRRFPLDVLEQVDELTRDVDMHDEPRAKLVKAIGTELARDAEALESGTPEHTATASLALGTLQRAQALHDRIGVKTEIKRLEKALAPSTPPQQAGTPPAA